MFSYFTADWEFPLRVFLFGYFFSSSSLSLKKVLSGTLFEACVIWNEVASEHLMNKGRWFELAKDDFLELVSGWGYLN
ncbi:hypothetical protein CEXT_731261 [Caerostris extrusa]|uniref:Uncharacterized protein n=1 Tax=Caerostris extrusa TaxID=172846 RepID=A0AAV4X890_CAEEX|nr:hypothetical protein CEXT_731261 [Caerostris extrusa]